MVCNIGRLDRALRVLLGFALLSFAFFSGHPYSWVGYFGLVPLGTAVFGCCPVYRFWHVNSLPLEETSKHN